MLLCATQVPFSKLRLHFPSTGSVGSLFQNFLWSKGATSPKITPLQGEPHIQHLVDVRVQRPLFQFGTTLKGHPSSTAPLAVD